MRRAVDGNPIQTSYHGQKGTGHFGKHLGYDYLVKFASVKAPEDMVITGLFSGGSGGNYIEADSDSFTHRFLHLASFSVRKGQRVKEGDVIGLSGNTGAVTGSNGGYHLHHDTRKRGTKWNASFSNYIDWEKTLREAGKMPPVNSWIQLLPKDKRTTFYPGTTTKAGTINVTDNTFLYLVRGYDLKFPYRVIINSASAGGDGVALALYYTNGNIIPGWRRV